METAFKNNEQVILFQNRRGYAPFMICEDCGEDKDDVQERLCPYSLEIYNEEEWVFICDVCEHERWMDV